MAICALKHSTFQGSAGDRVIIELNAQSSALDPQLYLLDPSNNQIAESDDVDFGNDNRNSHIDITLPMTGAYTIRVSAFGAGGPYELILRRG